MPVQPFGKEAVGSQVETMGTSETLDTHNAMRDVLEPLLDDRIANHCLELALVEGFRENFLRSSINLVEAL